MPSTIISAPKKMLKTLHKKFQSPPSKLALICLVQVGSRYRLTKYMLLRFICACLANINFPVPAHCAVYRCTLPSAEGRMSPGCNPGNFGVGFDRIFKILIPRNSFLRLKTFVLYNRRASWKSFVRHAKMRCSVWILYQHTRE